MAKKLILLSDGTGNSAAKAEKTNVWRMFQAVDQSLGAQLVRYDDGVGTASNKYLAALGGAFGWGLKRNVLDLYKFVCRNYQPGDQLYGFGFSRGAYTIRVLVDLLLNQGLASYRSEEELDRAALLAYRAYRNDCFKPTLPWISPVSLARQLRKHLGAGLDRLLHRAPPSRRVAAEDMRVRFLGLWDTVGAYAMPVEEFKPVVNCLVWPMLFNSLALPLHVERACHALSLDDERTTFHPIVWDERQEALMIKQGKVPPNRLSQVWFAGVHANVGGGYAEDQLSQVSLDWMMSQARDAGLVLLSEHVRQVSEDKSGYARRYDARSGFGVMYRYSPRQIQLYNRDPAQAPILPVIHHSVIMRMAYGSDRYSPLPLPSSFWVLAQDGELLAMDGAAALRPQEHRSAPGTPQILNQDELAPRMQMLRAAIAKLSNPSADAIELVQDTVWWRRLSYFMTLILALTLALFPWIWSGLAGTARWLLPQIPLVGDGLLHALNNVSDIDQGSYSLVASAVDGLSSVIPTSFGAWTNALKQAPVEFITLAAALAGSLYMNAVLRQRIEDRGMYAWHRELGADYLGWLREHEHSARRFAAAAGGAGLLLLLAAVLPVWEKNSPTRSQLAIVAVLTVALAAWRAYRARSLLRQLQADPGSMDSKDGKDGKDALSGALPSPMALQAARVIRRNRPLFILYEWTGRKLVPCLLGVGLVALFLGSANRAAFELTNAAGYYCRPAPRPEAAGKVFPIDNPCWASGYQLKRNHVYRLTLTDVDGDWFDRSTHADLGGFEGASWTHLSATLLKRWWRENWFTPIARIGRYGSEEYALHPLTPFAPVRYPALPEREQAALQGGAFARASDALARQWLAAGKIATPEGRRKLVSYLTPQSDGELYLYVNDAVLMVPGVGLRLSDNNHGSAIVELAEVEPAPPPPCALDCK